MSLHSSLGGAERLGVACLVAAAIAAPLAGCSSPSKPVNIGAGQVAGSQTTGVLPPERRPVAPPLTGSLLTGEPFELLGQRGRVVVINTWGSWCAPCRAEAPALEKVYADTRDSGVFFLGINVRDNRPAAEAFQRTFGVSYPSIFDGSGSILAQFRELPPAAVPSTLVLDRQGRVAARFIGGVRVDDLLPVVQQVSAEP